jgi:hypothetical protein
MKITLLAVILFSVALSSGQTPGAVINRRIFPGSITQTEPVITVHPLNRSIMFASAVTINTNNGFKSEGVYYSTDGGLTWSGSDTCMGAYIGNHGGDPGVAINQNGDLILTHIGSIFSGVYSHYSTDRGNTWSNAYTITSDQPEDKGSTYMDNNPTSPYFGRIYSIWVSIVSPYSVLLSYSADGGRSWSAPSAVYTPAASHCSGGSVRSGADGTIYACWALLSTSFPFIEDSVGFAASADGGSHWVNSKNIIDVNGINGILSSKNNIRVNGLPQIELDNSGGSRNGAIYIVTTQKDHLPAGSDPDIIVYQSNDSGKSWSEGTRVNQDALNDGKTQYFPALHVDSSGVLNLIYYDDRNTSLDSSEIMLSRSMDGGETWKERIISDHRFQPKPILGGSSTYQGDHIALMSANDKLHSFWMDDYSGLYQVWSAVIDPKVLGVENSPNEIPSGFFLSQNYPNPFNAATRIEYSLPPGYGGVITVYDILGRETALFHIPLSDGSRRGVEWNAINAASSVYLYRLIAANAADPSKTSTLIRSMLLIK